MLLRLLAVLACAVAPAPSPTPTVAEAPPEVPVAPAADAPAVDPVSPPMPGSYTSREVNDEARTAAIFAVTGLARPGASLQSVDAVETQVVAGLNHRLDLTLSDGSRWRVVVYRNLQGEQFLSSQEALPTK